MFKNDSECLKEENSIKKEIISGITIFCAGVYIFISNTFLLEKGGIPFSDAYFSQLLSFIVINLGLNYCNNKTYLFLPSISVNAYITYILILSKGTSYSQISGAVLLSGVFFILISYSSWRQKILNGIPLPIKMAISAGIGMMLSVWGLRLAGIVIPSSFKITSLGDFSHPITYLSCLGIVIIIFCRLQKIAEEFFVGISVVSVLAFLLGEIEFTKGIFAVPLSVGKMNISFDFSNLGDTFFIFVMITLMLLIESSATVISLEKDCLLSQRKLYKIDAIALLMSSFFSIIPFVYTNENLILKGQEKKSKYLILTAIILAFIAIFCEPLMKIIAGMPAIVAPIFIIIGIRNMAVLQNINVTDIGEIFPVYITIIIIGLTFDIGAGIGIGILSFIVCLILKRKVRELTQETILLGIIMVFYIINKCI